MLITWNNAEKGLGKRPGENFWNSPANRPAGNRSIKDMIALLLNTIFLQKTKLENMVFNNREAVCRIPPGLSPGRLPNPFSGLMQIMGMTDAQRQIGVFFGTS